MAHVERGPHPAEVAPAEPPVVRVVGEILVIVPVHELVLQRRQEGGERDKDDEQWRNPAGPFLGGREGGRTVAPETYPPAPGRLMAVTSEQSRVLGFGGRL